MSSLNKANIIGRLGAEPEVCNTKTNTAVATMSVATTERYKDRNGEQQEKTQWHRIVAWGRLAEICQQYLKKGSLAYFEGPIETREWTDKEGVKRYTKIGRASCRERVKRLKVDGRIERESSNK